ncbi:MAG: hypothetical protein RLZZ77_872, partial [Bacteroidota bacterium]
MTLSDLPNLLSTFTVLIPLIIGYLYFFKIDSPARSLVIFISWSFVIDLKRWYIPSDYFMHLYFLYAFTEVTFFIWFINSLFPTKKGRPLLLIASLFSLAMWILCFVILQSGPGQNWYDSLFDSSTSAMLAIIAAYFLLQMTKDQEKLESQPRFWFLLGIFLYFFCSNFIFSFVSSDIVRRIWIIPITMN